MQATVLITGASGFAGGHLVDLLTAAPGQQPRPGGIVAWYRPGGTPPRTDANVRWEPVDLLDRGDVREAVARARPSIVYHCAGAAHVGRSWENTEATFAINVRGTHYLVEALGELGSRARVLIPGSAMVYAGADTAVSEDHPLKPSSPYALSKLAQELAAAGCPGVVEPCLARAFNHFGPGQDPWFVASGFARRIADIEAGRWEPEMAVGNLEAKRDMTDVRDTVRAYQLIAEQGVAGRPYNVCSGTAIAIGDLLERMLSRARAPIRVRVDPARYRPNDQPIVLGNPMRLQTELGWQPRIPLDQTLDDLLAFWRGAAPLPPSS